MFREPNLCSFPYVNAALNESWRFSSLTPSIIPHRVLKDVEIRGYKVPYNTQVRKILDFKWTDYYNFEYRAFHSDNFLINRVAFSKS